MATVLTNVGKARMINALNGGAHTAPVHIAWGTGEGTAGAADTTLFTEASEDRVEGTKSVQTVNETDDTYQVIGEIVAAGAKTITNAGLFDADESGNMYVKGDFTGIELAETEAIEFTFRITQTQG